MMSSVVIADQLGPAGNFKLERFTNSISSLRSRVAREEFAARIAESHSATGEFRAHIRTTQGESDASLATLSISIASIL